MDEAKGVLKGYPANAQAAGKISGEKLRVLFLLSHFDIGGVQFQLYLRLKHLDPARYACRIVVLRGGECHLVGKTRDLGVPVEYLHIDEKRSLWRRVSCVRSAIARFRPDIVDSLLGWDYTYGNLAATLERVPLILAELQNEKTAVRRTYPRSFRLFESLALRFFCNSIVCCSGGARRSYLGTFRGFKRKSMVIHDAIDANQPSPVDADALKHALGIPASARVIGTVGRLMEQKDHETLIRAAREVCNKHPETIFLIGGEGHLRTQLEEMIGALGLPGRVRLLGEVTDVYSFYALTDIFIMTSRWEGFPVVLLEAMAAGKPVISTRVGGISEMIEDEQSGLLCNVGDASGIASAVNRLVENPKLRSGLARRGQERVLAKFTIQRLIQDWTSLYETARRVPRHEAKPVRDEAPAARADDPALPVAVEAAGLPPVKRALVLRTCPLDRFDRILADLSERYPGIHLQVLCQEDVLGRYGQRLGPGNAHSYGRGKFSILKHGWQSAIRLFRQRCDAAVLPYNTPSGAGYWRWELFALCAGRARILAYDAWSSTVRFAGRRTPSWFARQIALALLESLDGKILSSVILLWAVIKGAARGGLVLDEGRGLKCD